MTVSSIVDFITTSRWKGFLFWTGAIVVIILATVLYQPAAAKTGSLLVWTRDRVYIMDIDTLNLERVGPATAQEQVVPSPGCFGQTDTPCWVVISERLYTVNPNTNSSSQSRLPIGDGFGWVDSAVSWSPDGIHLAYAVLDRQSDEAELRIYDVATQQIKVKAANVDPAVAVAWTSSCAAGLNAAGCELGYKQQPGHTQNKVFPWLIGFEPATGETQKWVVSPEEIFELRWTPDNILLYSRPKRFFKSSQDHAPAYRIPPGSQLANLSPDARYTLYYQPFRLKDCEPTLEQNTNENSSNQEDRCLHLGVWLIPTAELDPDKNLIYSADLSTDKGGLTFIPTWSPNGDSFVFFHEGKLVYYDLTEGEATIWYRSIDGKLRSLPIFSPNEEAVAFVDNEGQGFSEYRLVIVDPKLQPVEHIIQTDSGFKVLAWLPN